MRHRRHHSGLPQFMLGILLISSILSGCAPGQVDEPPALEADIPISTASGAALALFEEGQYLLDVGRAVKAREKFIAAIALDPGFVRAHFNQSNAALSFKEFQDCLDSAQENLESASDGEKLLVEINRTFLTNDTEKGVQLNASFAATLPAPFMAALTA